MMEIIPAILSEKIQDYINHAKNFESFANSIHLDVMDGVYVANKTPSVENILSALKEIKLKKNFHLMIENPVNLIEKLFSFKETEFIYIHIEFLNSELMKKYSQKIVPVIRVEQNPNDFHDIINLAKNIQIMTVKIGNQGNKFVAESLCKIKEIRHSGYAGLIHIDGHVNPETLAEIMLYKPNILNVGSFLSRSSNPKKDFLKMHNILLSYLD